MLLPSAWIPTRLFHIRCNSEREKSITCDEAENFNKEKYECAHHHRNVTQTQMQIVSMVFWIAERKQDFCPHKDAHLFVSFCHHCALLHFAFIRTQTCPPHANVDGSTHVFACGVPLLSCIVSPQCGIKPLRPLLNAIYSLSTSNPQNTAT